MPGFNRFVGIALTKEKRKTECKSIDRNITWHLEIEKDHLKKSRNDMLFSARVMCGRTSKTQ